jgi:hypothetical protein
VEVVVAVAQPKRRNPMQTGKLQDEAVGIKGSKFNMSMRIFFTVCMIAALQLSCAQKKTESCLDYSFGKEYPYSFKFYKDKIIIGDGSKLIVFNGSGKEVNRIVLSEKLLNGGIFLDFLPLTETSYLITIYGGLYEVTPKTEKLLNPKFGELLRGESPIAITAFQENDSINETNTNGIKFFNLKTGRVYNHPLKKDLGTLNFENINESVALCDPYNKFYLLPMDTAKEIKVFDIPFDSSNGYYSFLGVNQGDFIFLTRDYNKKEDRLHFYDSNMKFVKEAMLDVSYDEISDVVKKDGNFYMEAPFGNFFSFDKNTNTVYVFRHTKKNGICFFPIENHLRVVKKAN